MKMTVTFQLPEHLKAIAENQAASRGFSDLGEFISSLATDALSKLEEKDSNKKMDEYKGPKDFVVRSKEELEKKLLEAIDQGERGDCIEVTPEYWKKLKEDFLERHQIPGQP